MTYKEREIQAFLAKKSKSAIVLEMLLNREYVTATDIITYYQSHDPECPIVFTTSPHKLIEIIRERFGYDFVKDKDIPFFRVQYSSKGKQYKISDTFKQYYLDKMAGIF
jgi:hypothetical protein